MTTLSLIGANDISLDFLCNPPIDFDQVHVMDSDKNKIGNLFYNQSLICPFDLKVIAESDVVVVCAVRQFKQVLRQLAEANIANEKIFGYCDLRKKIFSAKHVVNVQSKHLIGAFLPKSGTEWLSHVLRKDLFSPLLKVRGGKLGFNEGNLEVHIVDRIVSNGGYSAAHIEPSEGNIAILQWFQPNLLLHVRDPRQSLLSYFHFFQKSLHEKYQDLYLRSYGLPLNYFDLSSDEKMDNLIETFYRYSLNWISRWEKVYYSNTLDNVMLTKYEDFIEDKEQFFERLFSHLDIKVDCDSLSPNQGEKNYRKGSIDEWKTVLNSGNINRMRKIAQDYDIRTYDLSV